MATNLKFFVNGALGSQLTNISDTTETTVYSANATLDRRINQFFITSDDSSDATATIKQSDGTETIVLGKVTIPDGSGTNGTDAAVDVAALLTTIFTQKDGSDNKYYDVPVGHSITVSMSAVTSGKNVSVAVLGASE